MSKKKMMNALGLTRNVPYCTNKFVGVRKRERTQNWTLEEKEFLLKLCREEMHIIENKRLDAGLTALKTKTWELIHLKFSATYGDNRTCNRLKEQWRRMKSNAQQEVNEYRERKNKYGEACCKKPSKLTISVWRIMQTAKKICRKLKISDGNDYSAIKCKLEDEDVDDDITLTSHDQSSTSDELLNDISNDDGDEPMDTSSTSYGSGKSKQIKTASTGIAAPEFNDFLSVVNFCNPLNPFLSHGNNNKNLEIPTTGMNSNHEASPTVSSSSFHLSSAVAPPMNDFVNETMKSLMDMKVEEHSVRMQILNTQLEAVKYNRDVAAFTLQGIMQTSQRYLTEQ